MTTFSKSLHCLTGQILSLHPCVVDEMMTVVFGVVCSGVDGGGGGGGGVMGVGGGHSYIGQHSASRLKFTIGCLSPQ